MKRPASPTWRHFSLLLLLTLINEAMTFKVTSDPSLIQSNESSAAEDKASEIISAVDHCLAQRMVDAETDDWKLERLNKVRTAEVVMRLVRAKVRTCFSPPTNPRHAAFGICARHDSHCSPAMPEIRRVQPSALQ
ncbi:unnamed protein product [Symbiodinium sp. CCMP2456]|nr:unnamed protein product [Symbiodinium sp. CCMP2456]